MPTRVRRRGAGADHRPLSRPRSTPVLLDAGDHGSAAGLSREGPRRLDSCSATHHTSKRRPGMRLSAWAKGRACGITAPVWREAAVSACADSAAGVVAFGHMEAPRIVGRHDRIPAEREDSRAHLQGEVCRRTHRFQVQSNSRVLARECGHAARGSRARGSRLLGPRRQMTASRHREGSARPESGPMKVLRVRGCSTFAPQAQPRPSSWRPSCEQRAAAG